MSTRTQYKWQKLTWDEAEKIESDPDVEIALKYLVEEGSKDAAIVAIQLIIAKYVNDRMDGQILTDWEKSLQEDKPESPEIGRWEKEWNEKVESYYLEGQPIRKPE